MNGKIYHDKVCEKLNIPIEKQIKEIPSDDELEKLFDELYKGFRFDDKCEIITVQGAFVKGYFTGMYKAMKITE